MTQVNSPFFFSKIRPISELSQRENNYFEQVERVIQQLYQRSGGGTVPTSSQSLALNQQITSTSTTNRQLVYAADSGVVSISKLTARNNTGSAITLSLLIKADQDLTGSIVFNEIISISANDTENISNLIDHSIPSLGSLQAVASSATGLYLTVSGAVG